MQESWGSCSEREQTPREAPFSFFIQWETSHAHLQLKVFLTFLKLAFVFSWIPCPGLTQLSHSAFWTAGSHFWDTSRSLVFSQVIHIYGLYPATSWALETPDPGLREGWRGYWSRKAFEEIERMGKRSREGEDRTCQKLSADSLLLRVSEAVWSWRGVSALPPIPREAKLK